LAQGKGFSFNSKIFEITCILRLIMAKLWPTVYKEENMNKFIRTIVILLILAIPVFATMPINTFSIVGCDPQTGELGVAVASKYFAVGSAVPWVKADIGAIATQAWVNLNYGLDGLDLLEKGLTPQAVIDSLTKADSLFQRRQIGVIDPKGNAASFTGTGCMNWAGGLVGKNCAAQGNILVSEHVVSCMVHAFEITDGTLGDKLMAALISGDSAGGDSRGKQSAALYVVKKTPGYRSDREIDIRVDDSPEPIIELKRIYGIAKALALLDDAAKAYQSGHLDIAVEHARKSVALGPNMPETYYDLACYLSLSGKTDEALTNIKTALTKAPHFKGMAKNDSDLNNLHKLPEFQELVK
jgi:uncharacterized Ntn-hydrolase superfamily protein